MPAGGRSVHRSWPGSWEGEGSPGRVKAGDGVGGLMGELLLCAWSEGCFCFLSLVTGS